ncbi:MAG: sigma-70 family RNA polymerase sigma factor [Solirubrobacteraceae bacterium]|nr:sigma-70 family RNA polymerase sigma factor [Solirubrobacteraceae bacterium]
MRTNISTALLRTQTDERLARLAATGHDRAFEAVVERYRRPLLGYARRLLSHDRGAAEDVVQAAFASAWGALRDGTEVRDLRPWLYRIVHNGALNAMKRPGDDDTPLIDLIDVRSEPERTALLEERLSETLDAIALLPDRQRAALLAVAFEGRSHADVGRDLGVNDTAVRQLVRRARSSLRAAATAVTPYPLASSLASLGGQASGEGTARIAELTASAGAGGILTAGAAKTGALLATVSVIAVGAPQVGVLGGSRDSGQRGDRAAEAHEPAPRRAAGRAGSLVALPDGSGSRGAGGANERRGRADRGDDRRGESRSGGDDREDRADHGRDRRGRDTQKQGERRDENERSDDDAPQADDDSGSSHDAEEHGGSNDSSTNDSSTDDSHDPGSDETPDGAPGTDAKSGTGSAPVDAGDD